MLITLSDLLNVLRKIVDISLVWFIFYFILKNIKNNVKLSLIFKGVAFVIVLKIISDLFGFITVGYLLDYIIQWGPVALIIIFQPEIRTILEQLGRSQLLGRHKVLTVDEREHMVYEMINAIDYLLLYSMKETHFMMVELSFKVIVLLVLELFSLQVIVQKLIVD